VEFYIYFIFLPTQIGRNLIFFKENYEISSQFFGAEGIRKEKQSTECCGGKKIEIKFSNKNKNRPSFFRFGGEQISTGIR
jgi:hypothetical protein